MYEVSLKDRRREHETSATVPVANCLPFIPLKMKNGNNIDKWNLSHMNPSF
jgi:hypothetical protein